MRLLTSEARSLLDKLYNLRGEDSIILKKMNKEREEAIETQERTKNEKEVLLADIEKLNQEQATLAREGNKLMDVLSSINRDDFATVLDRLSIDFDPSQINAKVAKLLPETIDKVVVENQKASEKLANVEAEMNNAITKVEELGIRKDQALSNQAKLNEYIELSLNGNISITRDEIALLLQQFDFTENEQREAAKILMFPEDALFEYDSSLKVGETGKSITDVLAEAKKESVSSSIDFGQVNTQEVKEVARSASEKPDITNAFEKVIEENTQDMVIGTRSNSSDKEQPKAEVSDKEKLEKVIEETDLNIHDFSEKSFSKLLANYEANLLKENVQVLKENKINLRIINDNVELLYDKELREKIKTLIEIGKEARDINMMPGVLIKYDLKGLNNTINVLQVSGLDPKKVPLMAY